MKGFRVTKNVKEIKSKGLCGELESKKVSGNCPQNTLLLFMFLLTTKSVKNSRI